jgi:hypothetical protein
MRTKKATKFRAGLGCLISIVASLLAALLYPRAKWLLAFVPIGIAVVILNALLTKDPTPQALADEVGRLLTGNYGGWDVDDFEHQRIRDPQLRELWRRSMDIGGLPEGWVRLNEERRSQLQEIIRKLRAMGEARSLRGGQAGCA